MKKNFEQPALEVVRMNNRDIVTESLTRGADVTSGNADAPGRRGLFDPYDPYNAEY